MQSLPEPEIILLAQRGDTRAFRRLVERYQGFAYSLAFRFTCEAGSAEDIVQEAFIRVWKNLSRYRAEVKFSTWLYTIVTNRCLDYLRSRQGRSRRHTVDEQHLRTTAGTQDTDSELNRQELLAAILQLADALSPKQRAVFILRDLEGLPVEEVGDILSMSAGNIKSNLHHARSFIRSKLMHYYREPIKKEDL